MKTFRRKEAEQRRKQQEEQQMRKFVVRVKLLDSIIVFLDFMKGLVSIS